MIVDNYFNVIFFISCINSFDFLTIDTFLYEYISSSYFLDKLVKFYSLSLYFWLAYVFFWIWLDIFAWVASLHFFKYMANVYFFYLYDLRTLSNFWDFSSLFFITSLFILAIPFTNALIFSWNFNLLCENLHNLCPWC